MEEFVLIDRKTWKRQEYFDHYFSAVPCTYSMTVRLDVTRLRQSGEKLYPALLHCLARVVNRHEEFRTALNDQGQLGIYRTLHPCYTVFHRETETFSNLWTEYTEDYGAFCDAFRRDMEQFGAVEGLQAKPDIPANTFPVSMVPWECFEGFHLDLQKGYDYLLPIFTMGRCCREGEREWMPLAVQVHHAVCDGFHVCRLVGELRKLLEQF